VDVRELRPHPPHAIAVLLVSVYLLGVGLWLLITQRIPAAGFIKMVISSLRRPYRGELSVLRPEQGHCFVADMPEHLLSDGESASRLRLYEDDRELGPAHSPHDKIRAVGQGRYSHWGPQLYFSASDNSDPRSNGRRYRVVEAAT